VDSIQGVNESLLLSHCNSDNFIITLGGGAKSDTEGVLITQPKHKVNMLAVEGSKILDFAILPNSPWGNADNTSVCIACLAEDGYLFFNQCTSKERYRHSLRFNIQLSWYLRPSTTGISRFLHNKYHFTSRVTTYFTITQMYACQMERGQSTLSCY
jgi:hypothetical protein